MPPAPDLPVHILYLTHLLFDDIALKAFDTPVNNAVHYFPQQEKYPCGSRSGGYNDNCCNYDLHLLPLCIIFDKFFIHIIVKPPGKRYLAAAVQEKRRFPDTYNISEIYKI